MEQTAGNPDTRPGRLTLLGIGVLILVSWMARAGLTANLPSNWMPDWSEDFVFVSQAREIAEGNWLGPYNFRQLKNPPGLSLTLALTRGLGVTFKNFTFFLLMAAGIMILVGLMRLGIRPFLASLAFLAVLFNPALFGAVCTRLTPEHLFVHQYLLAAGLVLNLLADRSMKTFCITASALTLIFAWASVTVTGFSSMWVLFAGAALAGLLFTAPTRGRSSHRLAAGLSLLVILGLSSWAAQSWVRGKNFDHYGIRVMTEDEEAGYLAALGAIRRVARVKPQEFEPLTTGQRRQLYAASPLMKELEETLESPIYSGPSADAKDDLSALGRRASTFRLALREAAAQAGRHDSAEDASRYFHDLAAEINEACDTGRIEGTKERFADDAPRWNLTGLGQAVHRLWYRVHELWRFDYEDMETADALAGIAANQEEVTLYQDVLRLQPGAMAARPYVDAERRAHVRGFYQWLFPALFFAAIVAWITQFALISERKRDNFLIIESLLFFCCIYHAFAVSWQEIFWRADQGRTLFPAYFLLVVWVTISLGAYARFGRPQSLLNRKVNWQSTGVWALAAAILIAAPVVNARAAGAKSPILEQRSESFADFFIFRRDAALDATSTGIGISFPEIASDVEFRWKRMEFSDAKDLVIEAELATASPSHSFEIAWTGSRVDDVGGQVRQLFAKTTGLNRWRIPLSQGRIKTISMTTRDSAGFSMVLRRLALEKAQKPHVVGEFPLPKISASLADNGELAVAVANGERESRYDFYISGGTDVRPRVFPNRSGGMFLNDSAGIKRNGEAVTLSFTTDADGNGAGTFQLSEGEAAGGVLYVQGLGTKHFTTVKEVERK